MKVNENMEMAMSIGVQECDYPYTVDMIVNAEKAILVHMEFKINQPTPYDFLQFFLYSSNKTFDFSSIIQQSLAFAYMGIIGKKSIQSV